jgi:hypothetical protein
MIRLADDWLRAGWVGAEPCADWRAENGWDVGDQPYSRRYRGDYRRLQLEMHDEEGVS